jgi:hypothetical protein
MINSKLNSNHEFVRMFRGDIEDRIAKYGITSIKRFNPAVVGFARQELASFGVIEECWFCNPKIHLVISESTYIMEKLQGIDAIEVVRGRHLGMKITIKWVK